MDVTRERRIGAIPDLELSGRYLGTFAEETVTFQAIDALQIIALQADTGLPVLRPDHDRRTGSGAAIRASRPSSRWSQTERPCSTRPSDDLFSDFRHFDLIFDFTPFFPNCCTDVDITFSARFGPGYDTWEFPEFNPTWGIDNFVVSSTPIPEPATGGLVGLGLLLLAARKRRPGARL